MNILNFLKRQKTKAFIPGTDTFSSANVQSIYAQNTSLFRLFNFAQLIQFYESVEPCADAIDTLAEKTADLKMKIKDISDNEFVDNVDIDNLIAHPNAIQNWRDIYLALATYYLITGNAFLCVTRGTRGQLLEFFIFEPQYISIERGSSLYPDKYFYSPPVIYSKSISQQLTFNQQEINGQIRYITSDNTKELCHLRRFNPNGYQYNGFGQSKLQAIIYELMLDQSGSIHNLALLKNGARISGMMKLKDTVASSMTEKQEENLRSYIDNFYTSDRNAGRVIFSSFLDDFVNMMQTNRDMDFKELKTEVKERMYQRFKIPLALIQPTSLSMANMNTAQGQLYDNAVFPLTKNIYMFLSRIFRNYFASFENQELYYDEYCVESLRMRRLEEVQLEAALNVTSDNEIRNMIDKDDYIGGDIIYKPSTLIPAGDADNEDNSDNNDDDNDDNDEEVNNE